MKVAVRDYFQSFKIYSSEVLRYSENQIALIAMVSAMLSLLFTIDRTFKDVVSIFAIYIPILFIQFDVYIHPVKFEKAKYLCPMSEADRKNLINDTYSFRVAVDMILSLVGVAIIALLGNPKPITLFVIFFNDLILASRVIIRDISEDGKVAAKNSELRKFLVYIAWMINIVQLPILTSPEPKMAVQITFLIIAIVFELPLLMALRKQVKRELELAVNYEEASL